MTRAWWMLVRGQREKATDSPLACDRLHLPGTIGAHTSRALSKARAFTIVEAVLATVIVAVMLVAALTTVGVSKATQHKASLVGQGRLLTESLMSEILRQSYEDAKDAGVLGRESGESDTTRAAFDDVDDYHGWSSSPPTAKDGTALLNGAGWSRTVTVEWVIPTSPQQVKSAETGAKRVTVTAAYNKVPQATLVAIRTAYR